MRPVRLHVEGFGVFRAPVDLDFDDVDYFAMVGPTGAGKSTIIDALCFALYGSIPRYGDERLVGRAVSVGGREAKVSLTFDVAGVRYHATRVVRLGKGKADAILERDIVGGTEVLASGAREMKTAVEQLLGLPFAHFTKCVVLPQGEFAKFLHDEPAKRRELLTRLLDLGVYQRIGQRAREAAKDAARAVELHERQLEELAFATDDAREQAAARVEQLLDLCRAVDEARPDDERDTQARDAVDATARAADALATLLAGVVVPEPVDALGRELTGASAARDRARVKSIKAAEALGDAEAACEALGERDELARAHDAHVALGDLDATLAAAAAEVTRLAGEEQRAGDLVARARTHVTDQQAAVEDATAAHAAHELRAHLVAGEPCPVCTTVVREVPKRRRPAAITKAEQALAEARTMLEQAEGAHAELAKLHAGAEAKHAQLAGRRAELHTAVVSHPDATDVVAALVRFDAAQQQLTAARTADKQARVAEARAAEQLVEAEQRAAEARTAYAERRDQLLRGGCEPPPPTDDLAAGWHALAAWATGEADVQQSTAATIRRERDALEAARAARVAGLIERARTMGLGAKTTNLGAVRDEVFEHGTAARHELRRIEESLERAGKLREEVDAARVEQRVAHTLGELLKSDRFEKWVLAEALAVLVDAASRTLFSLTQGRYSLRYSSDEEFVVVDHGNADETRSVRTLSGGETFQASLALALALSDQLAELSAAGGAKLDAIFCDEGFGSLDADTLDAVATTIESLATSGRVVGLVTHVPALAERVPVRFRVHDGTVTREET